MVPGVDTYNDTARAHRIEGAAGAHPMMVLVMWVAMHKPVRPPFIVRPECTAAPLVRECGHLERSLPRT